MSENVEKTEEEVRIAKIQELEAKGFQMFMQKENCEQQIPMLAKAINDINAQVAELKATKQE